MDGPRQEKILWLWPGYVWSFKTDNISNEPCQDQTTGTWNSQIKYPLDFNGKAIINFCFE